MPIAIVSIVDHDRIWFTSHLGVEIDRLDRGEGLCASAIVHQGPWIIEDAAVDVRALSNPLRAGGFGLQCDAQEIKTLDDLPTIDMNDLDLRHKNRLRTQKDPDEPCGLPVNSDADGGAAGPTPKSVDRKVAG